jgi:hypothetical protein
MYLALGLIRDSGFSFLSVSFTTSLKRVFSDSEPIYFIFSEKTGINTSTLVKGYNSSNSSRSSYSISDNEVAESVNMICSTSLNPKTTSL